MRIRLALWLCLLLSAVGSAASADTPEATARKEIETQFAKLVVYTQQMVEDSSRANIQAFMSLFASDYVAKNFDGRTLNRRQMEAALAKDMQRITQLMRALDAAYRLLPIQIASLSLRGNTATVIANETGVFAFTDTTGRLGLVGQTHQLTNTKKSRYVWVKTGPTWKIRRSEQLGPYRVFMDGKPMNAPKKGAPPKPGHH